MLIVGNHHLLAGRGAETGHEQGTDYRMGFVQRGH